jgi:alpha-L-arabinofuranosidase/dienelactone hydrolase
MNTTSRVHVLAIAALLPAASAASCLAGRASITIDAGAAGRPNSPLLYGIFYEDINHAADGGLSAELVRNRSFEDSVVPSNCTVANGKFRTAGGWEAPWPQADALPGWTAVTGGGGTVALALETRELLNKAQSACLRMEVKGPSGLRAGVANGGFWGMAVGKGESYSLSLFARANAPIEKLGVALEDGSGRTLARGEITGLSSVWKRLAVKLTSDADAKDARLVLTVDRAGTAWLDVVSLFPEKTWKGRPRGLRPDLAEMLAGLRPSFVRFPGGCFVEGFNLQTALRWKDTIGDISERPGHWNLWGYRSTNGLGYHELLQMCEDLKAEPLLVVNCGMTCQFRASETVPVDGLEPWIQDALDAVEYANGPATSRWGRLRAEAGHPKPFGLKYLEIGNENSGPAYEERYLRFQKAIKARYPQLQLIANCHLEKLPMEIRDDHFYNSPEFFIAQATHYDRLERGRFKVYVGEYAVIGPAAGQGNLRAALAEAAFLTGLERNSDVVTMASYAPLFVNVHDRTWNPDSIAFDNASCHGTPSYHMQAMFSANRTDLGLPCEVRCEPGRVEPIRGAVGIGTWATRAEFKELRVTRGGEELFAPDLARGPGEFRTKGGEWSVAGGALRQSADGTDFRAVAGGPDWSDYTWSLKARKLSGQEGFLVLFGVRGDHDYLWWNIGGWNNREHGIEREDASGKVRIGDAVPGSIEPGRWYDIRVELRGPTARCYLDGKLMHEVSVAPPPALFAVAGRDGRAGDIILKVVNTGSEPQEATIALPGARHLAGSAVRTVLTSADPTDENSLKEPAKVAPRTDRIEGVAEQFRQTLAPRSVTVLRMSIQPTPVLLWKDKAPGATGEADTDKPWILPWLAEPGKANGTAVVICPGGGYGNLAMEHEGRRVAEWLNGLGISAFVLKYRHHGTGYGHPAPMLDVQRAIRLVRSRAGEWKLRPDRIGVLGFSAGGHLASTAGTHFDAGDPAAGDPIDRIGCRPDFMVLVYPVISFTEPFTHAGSRRNLLGDSPDPALVERMSNERQVTADTPPTFLIHTDEDSGVPAENSLAFFAALRRARVPAEMHVFREGPHGFGLGKPDMQASQWPGLCEEWMRRSNLLGEKR